MEKGLVLVTGGAGYIGSTLVRQLLAGGWAVRVLDRLTFGGESLWEPSTHPGFSLVVGDVRDPSVRLASLHGVSAVVHLAAIVGDPACKKFEEEATQTMDSASKSLFYEAQASGCRHFVFASTCSNYGIMPEEGLLLTEESSLIPQSHYARLKVGFEEFLLSQTRSEMASTILRFATAYGFGHRMRFDLTVNHFSRDLVRGLDLEVFGTSLWRPYSHVADLAASAMAVLEAGPIAMDGKVYNVGDSSENYTKKDIVALIRKFTDSGQVVFRDDAGTDLRNYRVDFSKIAQELKFRITRRVSDGVAECCRLVGSGIIPHPFDPKFSNG